MKKKIAVLSCGWSFYFINDFINGMRENLKETSADIYLFNCYDYTEFSGYPNLTGYSVYKLINYEDYDGVIILSDLINSPRVLEMERQRVLKSGKNVLSINSKLKDIPSIRIDNYSGTYELVSHLIKEHKVTDFAFISGKENSIDIAERYKAFREALLNNKIPINMDKVYFTQRSDYNSTYDFLKENFQDKESFPKAFVCATDLMAMAVLKVAKENNVRIPEDMKIVGYDDIPYSRLSNPTISTVKSNAHKVGAEAAKRVLNCFNANQIVTVKTSPVYRESCGCNKMINDSIENFAFQMLASEKQNEYFSAQMENIEEIFTEATDVFTLLTNLEVFFAKNHTFEGSDFCIFLKSDWSSVLINSTEKLPQNLSYGQQVQAITSIQNNEKYTREIINTRDLIPSKMKSDENNVYLIMPIYNHSYVHGYYVSKNNLALIEKHYGYTWTRTFGNAIERFRKQNMFKNMSQQYLRLSTRDALSGMINRVGLEKIAKPFYSQNKKNGLTTVLFFVDINKMKHINDNFGHLHGDLAVKTIASCVMEAIPKTWLPIRYGGDEFLVVGNSKNYNGEDYCKIITDLITKKTSIMQLPYNLSASIGSYSVLPTSTLTLEEAVEKCDEVMYKVKEEYHKRMQ